MRSAWSRASGTSAEWTVGEAGADWAAREVGASWAVGEVGSIRERISRSKQGICLHLQLFFCKFNGLWVSRPNLICKPTTKNTASYQVISFLQQHRCLCNGNDELVLRIGEHVKARELSLGQILLYKEAKRCLGIALNQQVKVVFCLNQLTLFEVNGQASQQNPRVTIILGAVLYGPLSAAFLGAVFGLTVCFSVISGNDAGGFVLFSQRPMITLLLCLVKSTAAGYLAGLCAKRKSTLYLSAAVAPLVNTGIFILGLVVFFRDTLVLWANGEEAVMQFILFSILGVNFLAELLLNLLLVPVILRILSGVRFTRDEIENT